MDRDLEDLIDQVMQLPLASRQQLIQLLREQIREDQAQDLLPEGMHTMTSVTVVLPDDLAEQAQAAGLLARKPLEALIRRALHEHGSRVLADGLTTPHRNRRLVRHEGRLVVEALADEKLVTPAEIRSVLDRIEW